MNLTDLDRGIDRIVAHHKDTWVMDTSLRYHPKRFVKTDLSGDLFPEVESIERVWEVKYWTVFDERNFPLPIRISFEEPGIYSISGERKGIVARKPTIYTANPNEILKELESRLGDLASYF